jgi:hypothetical protein
MEVDECRLQIHKKLQQGCGVFDDTENGDRSCLAADRAQAGGSPGRKNQVGTIPLFPWWMGKHGMANGQTFESDVGARRSRAGCGIGRDFSATIKDARRPTEQIWSNPMPDANLSSSMALAAATPVVVATSFPSTACCSFVVHDATSIH